MSDTLSAAPATPFVNEYKMTQEDGTIALTEVAFENLSGTVEGEHCFLVIGYTDVYVLHGEWEGKPTKRNVRKWLFQVVGGEFDGEWISLLFTNSLHENSKFRPLVEAMIGRELTADDTVDFCDLLGRKLYMTVISEKNARGYDNVKYGSCRKFKPKTSTAAAARKPAAARAAAVATDDDEDPFDSEEEVPY